MNIDVVKANGYPMERGDSVVSWINLTSFGYSAANIGDLDRGGVTERAVATYWDDDGDTGLCFADNGI